MKMFLSRLLPVVVMLLAAILACSLTEKTPEPKRTPEPTATISRPTNTPNPDGGNITPPTVQIVAPANGQQVRPDTPLTVTVQATHDIGVTLIRLFYIVGDNSPTLINNASINPASTEASRDLRWTTPSELGVYTLQAIAEHNGVPSEPATITVEVANIEPTAGPTVELVPCEIKILDNIVFRSGPNEGNIGTVAANEVVEPLGRGRDATGQGWYKVRRVSNGREGWITSLPEFVEVTSGCEQLELLIDFSTQ